MSALIKGSRTVNEVYEKPWFESQPTNKFSVSEFEDFCKITGIKIDKHIYLCGNWRSKCYLFPNLMAGYAIYDLTSNRL